MLNKSVVLYVSINLAVELSVMRVHPSMQLDARKHYIREEAKV